MHIYDPLILLLSIFSFTTAQRGNERPDRPPRGTFSIHSSTTNSTLINNLTNGLSRTDSQKGGRTEPEALLASGGSGCKANSVATNFNDEGSVFTVLFSDFAATIGNGVASNLHRRFCGVSVRLNIPAGWTMKVEHVDWRGYVEIDRGVKATFGSHYFWGERRDDKVGCVRHPASFCFRSSKLILM
jgi:hypothetical protein